MRGESLEPLILDGSEVKVAHDPGRVLPVERRDVVMFRLGGVDAIKIVYGVPGDRFGMVQKKDDVYRLLINGEAASNSEGREYELRENRYRLLSLYVNDSGGVIPQNTYLLLGDNPRGSRDSTAIGLIDRRDITGMVVEY